MRVYDLARQLKMENKELMEKIRALGIEVKSHSSSLDDKSVRDIIAHLGKDESALTEPPPAEEKSRKAPKKPAAKTDKPESAKPQAKPAPQRMDARAIALQAIERAKQRRLEAQRTAQAEEETLEAPEHQEIKLTGSKAKVLDAPAAPEEAETPPPPVEPKPQPPAGQDAAPQQPGPERPRVAERPAPPRGRDAGKREPQRPPHNRRPEPDDTRRMTFRRDVELQQLPSLPKAKSHGRGGRGAQEPLTDLAGAEIGVMKLRPTKRPGKHEPTEQTDEEGKARKKPALTTKVGPGEKRIRPGRFINLDSLEETVVGGTAKIGGKGRHALPQQRLRQPEVRKEPISVQLRGDLTVAEFAEKIKIQASDVIAKAMEVGEMLGINNLISTELCEMIASEFKVKVNVIPESDEYDVAELLDSDKPEAMVPRPPVVTVMGHVDHGKTSLLDRIRRTNVAEGEFGGITQHIGAYTVETARGKVIFLDTPGHEAFTAMRARGASVTDIVVLVVAADDGLMPQTVEAINHSRAAKVPIIVAINKIDIPGANVQRVRTALMQYSLISEDLGGDTIITEISAKMGTGIDELLEMILLQAEMMELKADPTGHAAGVVIESDIDPQRGTSATVLVKRGTLRVGDAFVSGSVSGRIRSMLNDHAERVEEVPPAHPVRIHGLSGCPQVGEDFVVLENERQARQIAQIRDERRRRHVHNAALRPHVTLENFSEYLKEGEGQKTLNLILKADVQGSVEAVSQAIQRLSGPKVTIDIIHNGVGAISESDVQLAMASDAVIIGFNVRPDSSAAELASQEKIEIKTYRVIYSLTEDLQAAMLGMLDKKYREVPVGKAQIRQVFRISRIGTVAGLYVTDGTLTRNDKARLVRDGVVVYEGTIASLRRIKEDVSSVNAGYECGLTLANFNDYQEGDVVEVFKLEEVAQSL